MREASAMVIVQGGLFLGVSRRDNPTKFGFPAGKVEPNETIKEAAIRETFEETGIIVHECQEIYAREEPPSHPGGEPFLAHAFYAIAWEGIPRQSEEGVVKWVLYEDLVSKVTGAFPKYNWDTINALVLLYPNIYFKGE